MLAGLNHVAVVTRDIERLIAFYSSAFEATIRIDMTEPVGRHALIDLGRDAALHVFEMPSNPHSDGTPRAFDRGHLDHLALNVADEHTFQVLRRRLVEMGACDGTVTDFGSVKTCFFRDPDGMDCEIAIWGDAPPRAFDERVVEPLADATGD